MKKSIGDACDLINNSKIGFTSWQKKCPNCGSQEFEQNMIGTDTFIEMELPVVSHNAWNKHNEEQKKNCIFIRLKPFIKGSRKIINKIIDSGNLGLNDLDIAEAIRDDLEYAIGLFK